MSTPETHQPPPTSSIPGLVVIGINGPAGSGKTHLAKEIVAMLNTVNVNRPVVRIDIGKFIFDRMCSDTAWRGLQQQHRDWLWTERGRADLNQAFKARFGEGRQLIIEYATWKRLLHGKTVFLTAALDEACKTHGTPLIVVFDNIGFHFEAVALAHLSDHLTLISVRRPFQLGDDLSIYYQDYDATVNRLWPGDSRGPVYYPSADLQITAVTSQKAIQYFAELLGIGGGVDTGGKSENEKHEAAGFVSNDIATDWRHKVLGLSNPVSTPRSDTR